MVDYGNYQVVVKWAVDSLLIDIRYPVKHVRREKTLSLIFITHVVNKQPWGCPLALHAREPSHGAETFLFESV